jgi:hypothetical protein
VIIPTFEKSIMRNTLLGAIGVVTVLATAAPAACQARVDRTVATPATGTVEVSNVAGELRIVAWDRDEVRVTGTLGEGTERLDVTSSGDRVRIEVVIPRNGRNVQGSDLEVRVPARKNVVARGVSAEVEIAGVTGTVEGRSTSGSVRIEGSPAAVRASSTSGEVEVDVNTSRVEANSTSGSVRVAGSARESIAAESVSGSVEVRAPAPELMAKTVSGEITITGATRRLSASTVSGEIAVSGARLQYGSFESVSGDLHFSGVLESDAAVNIESHSGDVTLELPGNVGARFQVLTFSGDIRNAFGAEAQRTSRYGPGEELRFTSGNGGAMVTAKTFSGDVRLERRD